MSLFEDNRFVYRDTFFVYFQHPHRPTADEVAQVLKKLGDKYEFSSLKSTDGKFESISVHSPQDYSAMDITCIIGEEVREQIKDMMNEFKTMTLTGEDREKLSLFEKCDSRLDVYHFEEVSEAEEEDEVLDPGGLLLVMGKLARLCHGVGLDPQSQTLL